MRHELFGVLIDDVDQTELSLKLEGWLTGNEPRVIVTPNAEFLLETRRRPGFTELLNRSDVAIADSVSLQFAVAALSDSRLTHRIPGVDMLEALCRLALRHNRRILLLGGRPGSADLSAQQLRQRYKSLDVVALDPGQISWKENRLDVDTRLQEKINALAPSIVAVAFGQYKQEQFISQVRSNCPSVRIWIGVGGALEMISGQKRRAPGWMSRMGVEWLWRLLIEPRRWPRIFNASIVFPLIVAREAARQGHLLHSTRNVFSELYRQWFAYER